MSKEQKRVQLTHGTARVDADCPKETVDALNALSVAAQDKQETPFMDFIKRLELGKKHFETRVNQTKGVEKFKYQALLDMITSHINLAKETFIPKEEFEIISAFKSGESNIMNKVGQTSKQFFQNKYLTP